MKTIVKLTFYLSIFFVISCGKKDPVPPPNKATLLYPEQNSACITATLISNTQSSLTFMWNASANTNEYEVHLKNLITGLNTVHLSKTNQIIINLGTNIPYSWYVVSKSHLTSETSQSDVWRFYNSGPTILSHAPFPADALAPKSGQAVNANKVNLSWLGTDVDNDIVSYDLYFGITNSPNLYQANVTESFVNNIDVASGTNYYWKVVTRDAKGNTSSSTLFHFVVN